MLFYFSLCHYTVGNKDDNPERKVVEKEDAMKFAEQMGIQVFETSAKDNKNVEEVCNNVVNLKSLFFALAKHDRLLSFFSGRHS